jgi:phosphotransferase system enzyme I (PtsP)
MILELDIGKAESLMAELLQAPSGSVSIKEKLKDFAEKEGLPL